jgi:hypothetical protein
MLRIKKDRRGTGAEYVLRAPFASKTLWLALAISAVAHLMAVGLFRIRLFTPPEEPTTYKATVVAIDPHRYSADGVEITALDSPPPLAMTLVRRSPTHSSKVKTEAFLNPFITSQDEDIAPRLECLKRRVHPPRINTPETLPRCFPVRIIFFGAIAQRTLLCDGSQLFRPKLPDDPPILLFKPRCAIEYSVTIEGYDSHISSWKRCGNLEDSAAQKCADDIITALRFAPSTSGNGTIRIEFATTGKKLTRLRAT